MPKCDGFYRLSHVLGLEMILIQRIVFFLLTNLREGVQTFNEMNDNPIQPQNIGTSIYDMLT